MKRAGALSSVAAIIVLFSALVTTVHRVAWADSPRIPQMVFIVADAEAIRQSGQGISLTRSFIGLIATLKDDQPITFISVGSELETVGPFLGSDPEVADMQDSVESWLRRSLPAPRDALADAVAEAHVMLGVQRAAPGSSIYLITGDSPGADFARLGDLLSPLAARIGKTDWTVNGMSLPGASTEATDFLKEISTISGGRHHELSIAEGFRQLTDSILSEGASGSLTPVGDARLKQDDLMSTVVSIAPGTRETTLLLFKESPLGSLRLSNPGGFEAPAGDRTASHVLETPHMILWRLIDPMPGDWTVDARGLEGLISAWEFSTNKYSLVLHAPEPLPLDEPVPLVASVQEDDLAVALKDVRMFAIVTTPDGGTVVHELRDDGIGGDAVEGDGFFSAVVSPLNTEGQYDVQLELSWLEYDHKITSLDSFELRAFPSIEVRTVQHGDMEPGNRTHIGTVYVHVSGEPYPVSGKQLTAALTARPGNEGLLELEPRRLFGNGPAWEHDIFFTPQQPGRQTLLFRLNLEYAGRPYSYTSRSLVLSSVAPPTPVEESVPPVVPLPVAAPVPPPSPELSTPPPLVPVESQFPWPAVAVPGMVLLVLAAGVAYLLTRTRPFGYLYDDRDEPLVDFAAIQRHPIVEFFFRNSMKGRDLNVRGLEGLAFKFSGDQVRVRSLPGAPSVRVNNQPLIDQATIEERAWIGIGGKLFSFLSSPLPSPMSAGDD